MGNNNINKSIYWCMWESQSSDKWNLSKVLSSNIGKFLLINIFTRLQGKDYHPSWQKWQNESPYLAKRHSQGYCISSRWCDEIPRQTNAQLNNKMKLPWCCKETKPTLATLNKRNELVTACRHRAQYSLKNFIDCFNTKSSSSF